MVGVLRKTLVLYRKSDRYIKMAGSVGAVLAISASLSKLSSFFIKSRDEELMIELLDIAKSMREEGKERDALLKEKIENLPSDVVDVVKRSYGTVTYIPVFVAPKKMEPYEEVLAIKQYVDIFTKD